MKNGNRRFIKNEVNHIYQRAIHGFNIFYSQYDRLTFYTIFSHFARKRNIKVLGLCIMTDHIHALVQTGSRDELSEFISLYSSLFARFYNNDKGFKGKLFEKSFGSAPKIGEKKVRTAIAYLFNNPVEKLLCPKAEDFRWNFLGYATSAHPFSKKLQMSCSSSSLRKAIKIVKRKRSSDQYLNHQTLRQLFNKLDLNEQEQLTDYIIATYSPFDYDSLIRYFGNYDKMLIAINANTGSEYEIREEYIPNSDTSYKDIADYLTERFNIGPQSIASLSDAFKSDLHHLLLSHTHATSRQICKYLRIKAAVPKSPPDKNGA